MSALAMAERAIAAGRASDALAHLEAAAPSSRDEWLHAAELWSRLPGAEERAAVALSPAGQAADAQVVIAAARAAIAADRPADAERWLRDAAARDPEPLALMTELSSLLTMSGRAREAIPLIEARASDDPRWSFLLGATCLQAHLLDDAQRHLEASLAATKARGQDSAAPRYQLGLCLATRQDLEGALSEFERCIELDPSHLTAHYQLIAVAERLGREDVAARARLGFSRLNTARLASMGMLDDAEFDARVRRGEDVETRKRVQETSFERDMPAGATLEIAVLAPRRAAARFVVAHGGNEILDVVHEGESHAGAWHRHVVALPSGLRGARALLQFRVLPASGIGGLLGRDAPQGAAFAEPILIADPAAPAVAPRPNIVLISLDTLRGDRLGVSGSGRATSPAIDAIAARGVRASRAEATSTWTLPSHYSMLSGLSPAAHGVLPDRSEFIGLLAADRQLPVVGSGAEVMLAEALHAAGWRTSAVTEGGWMAPGFGFGQGFDVYRASENGSVPATAAHALAEIDAAAGAGPWFLFVHTYAPHQPYHAPRDIRTTWASPDHAGFAQPAARVPMNDYLRFRSPLFMPSRSDVTAFRDLYDGDVLWSDGLVGAITAKLKEKGLERDTIVVITSDHGEELFERGRFDHGDTMHEELTHVPLILSAPGRLPEGVIVDGAVSLIDLPATLLDLAGLGDALGQGRSLRPAWEGREKPGERMAFGRVISSRSETIDAAWAWPLKLVRTENGGTITEQLFDLAADPGETRDLASARKDDLARLGALLDEHLRTSLEIHATLGASADSLDPATLEQLRSLGYVQ